MRSAWATLALWLVAIPVLGQTTPKVLLVQIKAPIENNVDFNVNVRHFFAQEFDEDGRLEPLTWSMTDPAFRKAVESKLVVDPPESPSINQASDVAAKLGCEYVYMVSALRHGSNVMADARMYKSRREIWKAGTLLQAIVQDAMQLESTARSVARTWIMQMGQGPLKHLKATPKLRTPDPDPGIVTPPNPPVADPVKQADDFAVRAEFDRLTKLGEHRGALQLLRDAIDAEPLNLARRKLLVQVLLERGDALGASKEARRAAGLFPEEVALWRMCARTSIESGDYPQAIRDLNEAVAREPDNFETRLLLGEAQLMAGRVDFALEHLQASIKLQSTPEAIVFRGAAYLAMSEFEHGKADLAVFAKSFPDMSPAQSEPIRSLGIRYAIFQISALGNDLRLAIQRIRLKPADPAHTKALKLCADRTDGLRLFFETVGTNARHKKSSDSTDLALNLLSQAIAEAQSFLASRSEDSLGDSTISLGEAFKALERAKSDLTAIP